MTNLNEPQSSDELAEQKKVEELEEAEEAYVVNQANHEDTN